MPITSQTDRASDLTIFKVTGVLNFDETMSTAKSFYDDKPTENVIFDLQEVSDIPFSSKEVEDIASYSA